MMGRRNHGWATFGHGWATFGKGIVRVFGADSQEKLTWLGLTLPPEVNAKIAWLAPWVEDQAFLELGWWDAAAPTVIIPRRNFRTEATIALICLRAP